MDHALPTKAKAASWETEHMDWKCGSKMLSAVLSKIIKNRWSNFIECEIFQNNFSKGIKNNS